MQDSNKSTNPYALFVLKPDAVGQILDPKIMADLEDRGLTVVKQKIVTFTEAQAARLYAEKKDYNYFPLLTDFMSSSPSICLILRSEDSESPITQAKEYRDWARQNLKREHFTLSDGDMQLLGEGTHPRQNEITRVMALENLIHVSDDFCAQTPLLGEVFNAWDCAELKDREPELYDVLCEARKTAETETMREMTIRSPQERI